MSEMIHSELALEPVDGQGARRHHDSCCCRGLAPRKRKRDRELRTGIVDRNIESQALREEVLGCLTD